MRLTSTYLLFGLMFAWAVTVNGQVPGLDTIKQLRGVEVYGDRQVEYQQGLRVDKIDSLGLLISSAGNLATLLGKRTSVYVKDYGQGNLATLAIRGTSSSQSGIFWNGFNLNAPGAGMIDLALIPGFLFDAIQIQPGCAADKPEGGVIGGAVYLGGPSKPATGNELTAGLTLGSFHETLLQLAMRSNYSTSSSKTAFQRMTSRNDFPYKNGNETFNRDHAGLGQYAFLQQIEKRYNNNSRMEAGLWWQQTERDLPPSLTSASQHESRTDRSFRASARWKKTFNEGYFTTGLAWFHDFLHYRQLVADTILVIDSRIFNDALRSESSLRFKLSTDWMLDGGLNLAFNTIEINKFGGYRQQSQGGAFVSVTRSWFRGRLKGNLGGRKEVVEGYHLPFCPSVGLEGRINRQLTTRLNVAGINRIPSMNDRFWQPGGNDQLKPERGMNAEAGVQYTTNILYDNELKIDLAGFYSAIDDWINWKPTTMGYWMAQNEQKVLIRGIETGLNYTVRINKLTLHLSEDLTLLSAVNQHQLNGNDKSWHKQLIYTPATRSNTVARLVFRSLVLEYQHSYTSLSYVTRDNQDYLPGHVLGNAVIRYTLEAGKKISLDFQVEAGNLWNATYQVVQYFPMPGRSYRLVMIARINNKSK
ncbi:MAG: TonB-dependent receptor [Bacteroidetes bacterium]|nr:TonB-dependent receptor [Bacteroidota bacterium]